MLPIGTGCHGATAADIPSASADERDGLEDTLFRTPTPDAHSPANAPVFWVGVGTHVGKQFEGYSDTTTLQRVAEAGAHSIRDEIYWAQVEREKGQLRIPDYVESYVSACRGRGIAPLILLGYGNPLYDDGGYPLTQEARAGYIRYATFVVNHFRWRVGLFEIWNEWDMGLGIRRPAREDGRRFRGDPLEYVNLVAAVAPELRKTNPDIKVLAGGQTMYSLHPGTPDPDGETAWEVMKGWFDEALAAGLLAHCDGLSLHTYTKAAEDPEYWSEWITQLSKRYADTYNQGRAVPLYITETGWFTHAGAGIDFQVQADYVARLYLLARTIPAIRGIWYFNLENDVFGLCNGSGSPRAAYWAWKDCIALVSHGSYLGQMETGNANVRVLRFRMPDGEEVWAAWTRTQRGFHDRRYNSLVTGYLDLHLHSEEHHPEPLRVTMTGMGTFTQPWGLRTQRYGALDPRITRLTLGPRPQLIRGPMSGVKIMGTEPTTRAPDFTP
ncbi:MAG: hypothetical protein JXB13_12935 [Phycisphaerae bacterium]|nr:hypothetical protein [Phycisphaerae bacterium]